MLFAESFLAFDSNTRDNIALAELYDRTIKSPLNNNFENRCLQKNKLSILNEFKDVLLLGSNEVILKNIINVFVRDLDRPLPKSDIIKISKSLEDLDDEIRELLTSYMRANNLEKKFDISSLKTKDFSKRSKLLLKTRFNAYLSIVVPIWKKEKSDNVFFELFEKALVKPHSNSNISTEFYDCVAIYNSFSENIDNINPNKLGDNIGELFNFLDEEYQKCRSKYFMMMEPFRETYSDINKVLESIRLTDVDENTIHVFRKLCIQNNVSTSDGIRKVLDLTEVSKFNNK